MNLSDFDYHLPPALIAQEPLAKRGASRLLCLSPETGKIKDRQFSQLADLINPGDLLVFNDTRVVPARLYGTKQTGGKIEVLVERIIDRVRVLAHIRSSKSPKPGAILTLESDIRCEMIGREGDLFILQLPDCTEKSWLSLLDEYGHMPLPPYIQRGDEAQDRERYQTVYASKPGAVAAPTAGLHFEQCFIDKLKSNGVYTAHVTLHVGAGTFQPVRVENLDEHVMHSEYLQVNSEVCELVAQTRTRAGRVIAVGTTVVRSLETASASGELKPFEGDSTMFIKPGYRFNTVDAMITNFHLPKSTLLMLVSAFAGSQLIRDAYQHAVDQQYRFFSYGDAMFIRSRLFK